jgi:hypothetical protein
METTTTTTETTPATVTRTRVEREGDSGGSDSSGSGFITAALIGLLIFLACAEHGGARGGTRIRGTRGLTSQRRSGGRKP